MSSIKAHAQVISVFGLIGGFIFGITFLCQYAIKIGHSEYIWYAVGVLYLYWVIRPLYLIMYDHFKNGGV